ncbi:MAG TPA: CHAD domain-containing protein [Vicinamibacterales bacterium]|nr:CHAD domain-containing protein [Vicinamibacterales bacterium]
MAYRFKPGRSLAADVRRIADRQLSLAIGELRSAGDHRSDAVVHEARRHIKKARALIRLVHTALGDAYVASNRRLRVANRMLGAIADGEAMVDTLVRLGQKYRDRLPRRTVAALRAGLLDRERRIGRKAMLERLLPRVASLLRREQQPITLWTLNTTGFRAVARGLERTVRRARRAARRAEREPTIEHYHAWRRRAKDLWLQVRLLEGRCRDKLLPDERRLEALDGFLGEYHNVVLLERLLVDEALASREDTARCLRMLRRYQGELRYRAITIGRAIAEEKPRHFVARARRHWQAAKQTTAAAATRRRWHRAA